ncbi:hypothetical protein [Robertmurraya massiliosenegalensis]|uniref:hypothetical protein n=1 Tax=Robertmurraya massiliosenegalensis TaxID=1287657 RepID=UPI00037EADC3|nr:hypothetical protein [Robertmurraya massiliosenegalensis]
MLRFNKKATLKLGEKVECYYNNRKGMISVRSVDIENPHYNRIVAHCQYIHLENVELRVRSGRKIIRGNYVSNLPIIPNGEQILYCVDNEFYTTHNKKITSAKYAVCFRDIIMAEQPYQKESLQLCN